MGRPRKIYVRTGKPLWIAALLAKCRADGLPEPVLEHRFHPVRRWRFDVAWPDQKVAIECHGAVYAFGHHTRGKGFEDDREKANEAQIMGWTILEYSTGQIREGIPLLDLKRVLTCQPA